MIQGAKAKVLSVDPGATSRKVATGFYVYGGEGDLIGYDAKSSLIAWRDALQSLALGSASLL